MIEKHFVAHPTWLVESITELFRKMFSRSPDDNELWDHNDSKNAGGVRYEECSSSSTSTCTISSSANSFGGCCAGGGGGIGKSFGRNGTSFQRAKRRHYTSTKRDFKSSTDSSSFFFPHRDKRHFKNYTTDKNQCQGHHHHHRPHHHHHNHQLVSNGCATGSYSSSFSTTSPSYSTSASSTSSPSSFHRFLESHWKIYVIVIFVSVANYLNSLPGDFVHDDLSAIKTNDDVKGHTPIWRIFLNDFWGKPMADRTSHKSYRPLTILTFR